MRFKLVVQHYLTHLMKKRVKKHLHFTDIIDLHLQYFRKKSPLRK